MLDEKSSKIFQTFIVKLFEDKTSYNFLKFNQ